MRLLLILPILAMSACGKITYKLSDGQTVNCAVADQTSCGWTFARCDDGGQYVCQTNFEQE